MGDMIDCKCILCGGDDKKFLFKANDTYFHVNEHLFFNVVECRGCGLVFISPRPSPEDMGEYYPDTTYWPALLADEDVLKGRILPKVKPYVTLAGEMFGDKKGTMLDIGCGDGAFLKTFKALGWEVAGIDQSEQVASGLREKFGLDVKRSLAEDYTDTRKFDFIIINHVLEHLHDPFSTIGAVREKLLKPDGVLAIGIPNFGSIPAKFFKADWVPLDVPRHLYQYTPKTAGMLLEKNGFEIVKFVFPIFSNFNRMSFRMRYYRKKDFAPEDRMSKSALVRFKNRTLLSVGKFTADIFSRFMWMINSCDNMVVVARPKK